MSKRSKDRIVVKAVIESDGKTRSKTLGYVAHAKGICGEIHKSQLRPRATYARNEVSQLVRECPGCIAERSKPNSQTAEAS